MKKYIKAWRKAFNLPVKTTFELPSEDEFNLAVNLIEEELNELKTAYLNKDKKEYLDAAADLEFVLTQLHCISGYDIKEAIKRVAASNMSKCCTDYSTAVKSVKQYQEKNIEAYIKEYNGLYFIYRKSDNKLLKSINFSEPYLYDLL